MSDETDLVLGDIVIPVGAGRDITQSLSPIDNGDLRRTVNGNLRDLTRDQNRKFESIISTNDQASPAFDGLWKGQTLTVQCIAVLRQNVFPADAAPTLIRDPVGGSVRGLLADGTWITPTSVVGRDVTFAFDVVLVQFRPIIDFMVVGLSRDRGEYEASESWSIQLEEV